MSSQLLVPVVFASPHSGLAYAPDFLTRVRLDLLTLRQSEDAFVDQLFGAAPRFGAPLLKALFPRVFVDPNREPYELDARMFRGALPAFVNTGSPRVAAGLGTVPRIVATGAQIYADKLDFAEVELRLSRNYFPYHRALRWLLDQVHERFGLHLLIDCHSMPSIAGGYDSDAGLPRTDFVLGDCFGTSCAPAITRFVERRLRSYGYSVRRNIPYAGGYVTRRYGRPRAGRHVLQIEINRALYLDEAAVDPNAGFETLSRRMTDLIAALVEIDLPLLTEI
jgi:N-formylglutamate amidohydrolase